MKGMIALEEARENLLQEKLEELISCFCEQNKKHYIQFVAEWVAYIIIEDIKLDVSHDWDPSWDFSGRLVEDEEGYNLDDYQSLYDFTDDSYNGGSRATYVSGHGLRYNTYSDELEEITDEWVWKQLEFAMQKLLREDRKLLLEWVNTSRGVSVDDINNPKELAEEMLGYDLVGDHLIHATYELMKLVGNMGLKLLYKKGEKGARDRIIQEEIAERKRAEEAEINRQKAEKLWNKVSKAYNLRYGRNSSAQLPQINKGLYKSKFKPVLDELYRNGIPKEEIRLLGIYPYGGKFSNSARNLVNHY